MTENRSWPVGGGKMGQLIRSFAWSRTPLGPVQQWSERLRAAVDTCLGSGLASFVWWGPELVQLYNDAAIALLGAKHPDALGRPAREGWPELWTELEPAVEAVLRSGEALVQEDVSLADADSTGAPRPAFFTFSYSLLRDADGNAAGLLVVAIETTEKVHAVAARQASDGLVRQANDALARTEAALLESERQRAEAALRETEGRFRVITDLVPDLLWSSDSSGAATWYNRRWTEYTGLTEEESLGEGWLAAVHPEDREGVLRAFGGALQAGRSLRHELRLRGADGEDRWFLLEASPAHDQSGGITGWFGALTNVHEQRLALQAAEQASEAKSQFLAVMSHELRTPLTGVISFSDLLQTGVFGPIAEPQYEALARIKSNSWHLVSIIDEVLTLSRAEAGRVEVSWEMSDLAELAREVVQILESEAERRDLALRLEGADQALPVLTDPGKVRQILLNLVGNAVKYTEQGEVRVEVERSSPEWLQVHIHDTGPGIAPEDQERIFQPFTQVDASHTRTVGGTGLGLAISRKLARLLDGDVVLRSALGQGSVFTLRLPWRSTDAG